MENKGAITEAKAKYWDSMNPEKKRQLIVYGIATIIIILIITCVILLKGGDKKEVVTDLSNPEAEQVKKYNNKTEASNMGRDTIDLNSQIDQSLGIENNDYKKPSFSNNSSSGFVEPDFSEADPAESNTISSPPVSDNYNTRGGNATMSHYNSGNNQNLDNTSFVEPGEEEKAPEKKKRIEFSDLPESERKKIMLQTSGQGSVETTEFPAKVISSGLISQGQTISLMSKKDAYFNFKLIPKGTKFSGKVAFTENRMTVKITSVRLQEEIIPVSLSLYGLDGLEGLAVNGDISLKEVQNETVDEVVGQIPSQAASVIQGILKAKRQKKSIKVKLAHDINVLIVNLNSEKYENL